ncbi:unnamed protein product [Blepharisma stoltei]|uniref:Uncharacterized protein n=1 Tax=Blepharisma stoltei TaxID=1481888 RepID=A0AAU9J412_9CILI|nr:unnamed protein product [Blepharisma stoltei]
MRELSPKLSISIQIFFINPVKESIFIQISKIDFYKYMKQQTNKRQKPKSSVNLSKMKPVEVKTINKTTHLMQKTVETSITRCKKGKKPKMLNLLEKIQKNQSKEPKESPNIKSEQDPIMMDWTPIFKTIIVSRNSKGKINEEFSGRKTMSSERKDSDLNQSDDIGIIYQKENPKIWAQGIENVPCSEAPIEDKPNFPIRF